MSTQTISGLTQAYNSLKIGDAALALSYLEDALSDDLENSEVLFTIKCANFCCRIVDTINDMTEPYQKGENFLCEWKNFSAFIRNDKNRCERAIYACKSGIFSLALECYKTVLADHTCNHKYEILCKTGRCHKMLGDYETALRFYDEANTQNRNDAGILSEMADCYALMGEEKKAKVLFRESYFIQASAVDTDFLESELICVLLNKVANLGYCGDVLKEWIPVYGVLYGVFTIKRELRALEVGKLRQSIFALENELKEAGSDPSLLIPRLINHYFWLIDHYVTVNGERAKINETLLKIKLLDSEIHEKYTL